MGKRPRRKIVLFLVEGPSDLDALFVPFGQFYDSIDESIEVDFCTIKNDLGSFGGDITSKNGVQPDNIARLIDELYVDPYLRRMGYYAKDIQEIIHIVDLDGVYIPDEAVVFDEACADMLYCKDRILTSKVDEVLERNRKKRGNLNALTAMETIKIDTKTVKYSIYYFSSNLDHFIHKDANLDSRKKRQLAQDFSAFHDEPEQFSGFFLKDADIAKDMDYSDSWNYIKQGFHSIQRHTNINLLFERLLSE